MRVSKVMLAGLFGMAAALAAAPAQAEILKFDTKLGGKYAVPPTDSAATGKAHFKVDTERKTVSMDLLVKGITADKLWDRLVAAPIGPIHIHKYLTVPGGDSVLVLPVPYGANYVATKDGLHVTVKDLEYAEGVKLSKSNVTFDQFLVALKDGLMAVNVHTDAFNPGEISGILGGGAVPTPVPGAAHKH
jgi:hypothetical protein